MGYVFVMLVFAFVCSHIADGRGRGKGACFFWGLLAGPIALIALLLMPKDEAGLGHVKCRFCAEYVKPDAVVCKHCGRDLDAPREGFGTTAPCLSCGHENPISARQCESCGHHFSS